MIYVILQASKSFNGKKSVKPVLSFTECLFEKLLVRLMFSQKIIAFLSGMERGIEFLLFFSEVSMVHCGGNVFPVIKLIFFLHIFNTSSNQVPKLHLIFIFLS
jgi:hypothetical protein